MALLVAKDDHSNFSMINESQNDNQTELSLSHLVYFDLAEASLRGWAGAGDAKPIMKMVLNYLLLIGVPVVLMLI